MKKTPIFILSLSFVILLSLTACSSKSSHTTDIQKTDELSERLKQYKAFLQDEISSETKSDGPYYLRDFCNMVVPEKTEDGIRYTLFDMTGDGLPELHVLTDISYSVHTIENNQLITWYQGDRHNRPLNNRAILQKLESTGTHYAYIVLDNKGEEVFSVGFSEPPGPKFKYLFSTNLSGTGDDDVELSKGDWDKLTKPFLSVGSDKIIWKNISDLDFLSKGSHTTDTQKKMN